MTQLLLNELDGFEYTEYNHNMDVKVYQKEEVFQPSGMAEVLTPDVIDIIPDTIEVETTDDIHNHVWTLDMLRRIADVEIRDGKLIINSDKVRYENGNLYAIVTQEQIVSCEILEDDSKELLEQQCALATIWQRGLDPLDLNDGVQWSETLLGEVNVLQLMEQISQAVSAVSLHVRVNFSVTRTENGQSVLTYSLREVA